MKLIKIYVIIQNWHCFDIEWRGRDKGMKGIKERKKRGMDKYVKEF
jgi:hypothetical protein